MLIYHNVALDEYLKQNDKKMVYPTEPKIDFSLSELWFILI
jgi:hypothetical protein